MRLVSLKTKKLNNSDLYFFEKFICKTNPNTVRDIFCDEIRFCNEQKQPPEVFCEHLYSKKLSQNSQENNCVRQAACNFITKETLTQLFSCEFCDIFKNTFLTEHLQTTVSTPPDTITDENL